MAFQEKGSEGTTNGVTAVTVVPAPTAGVRRIVTSLYILNVDTANIALTVRKNKNGSFYRYSDAFAMTPGQLWLLPQTVVLDAADESLEILLGGAVAANEPEFNASYGDAS